MTDRGRAAARALAAVLICGTAAALPAGPARSQAAQPAAPAPTYGPPLNGVCVFNRRAALDRSSAGQSVAQQLGQFAQGIKGELTAQRTAIVADDRALAQRKASTPPAQYEQSVNALKGRYAALDRASHVRQDQLDRTSRDAVGLIGRAMLAPLSQVITQRKCSLVVDTGVVFGANPAMDITGSVIQLLNARLPSVTVRLAPPRA
jgi:Skp family chaperone for outer membrane proteins